MSLFYYSGGHLYDGPPPPPKPPPRKPVYWTESVDERDLLCCIKAIDNGGTLIACILLGERGIRRTYLVTYEAASELSWEVLC